MGAAKKKTDQLGINISTAQHTLRKMIMFNLVQRCGLDICYQCSNKIEDIHNFSIEHKDAWLDSEDPQKMFFSLDNIAFSHLTCNVDNARKSGSKELKAEVSPTTGFKGVMYYEKYKKPYRACICFNRKTIWLGYHATAEEAARAYDLKAVELFSDIAITNRSLGLL